MFASLAADRRRAQLARPARRGRVPDRTCLRTPTLPKFRASLAQLAYGSGTGMDLLHRNRNAWITLMIDDRRVPKPS
jgi:hypothetical protein